MISKLKHKLIEKKYNKLVVKKTSKKHSTKTIKRVAILLDNESLENVMISNLTTNFPFKKENIDVLIYREYSKKQELFPKFFTNNDIGFTGSLNSNDLKKFVKNEYDLLINYVKTPNLYANMITLLSRAMFKTGFAEIDNRLYDLVVSDDGLDEVVLNQEIKKYLTILNKI